MLAVEAENQENFYLLPAFSDYQPLPPYPNKFETLRIKGFEIQNTSMIIHGTENPLAK